MRNYILIIISFSLLMGCTSLPSRQAIEQETREYNLPLKVDKDLARVFVVRPNALGGLVRFNVFADDQEDSSEMGWTRANQHVYFYLTPGQHKIYSKAENWAEIQLDAKAGEDIFIEQEPGVGVFMARNSIQKIDPLIGKYHVMKTGRGEILKTSKK